MKHSLVIRMITLFISYTLSLCTLGQSQNAVPMKNEWFAHSIVYEGSNTSIKRILKQARKDKKITIGAIGGSITTGAAASDFNTTSWASLVVDWFKQALPDVEISFINAGIGATNSVFGVHRIDEHLLVHKPNIIFIEYSVNDMYEEQAKISYESMIRKILKSENEPAIVCLGLMDEKGENCQEIHIDVCRHYEIPYLSYRDAIYPEIEEGNMLWRDLSPDEVHPNDTGHKIISNLVINYLEKAFAESPLPKPLTRNRYEDSYLYSFPNKTIRGWTLENYNWKTTQKGKPLDFVIDASKISIMYLRTPDVRKAANVYVYINGEKRKLNTYFENGWGDYMYSEPLIDQDYSSPHKITFEYDDKSGKEFILFNIQITP